MKESNNPHTTPPPPPNHQQLNLAQASQAYSQSSSFRKSTCPPQRWMWTRTLSIRLPTTCRRHPSWSEIHRHYRLCWCDRRHQGLSMCLNGRHRRPGTWTARRAARRRRVQGRPTSEGCCPTSRPWWSSLGDRPAIWLMRKALRPAATRLPVKADLTCVFKGRYGGTYCDWNRFDGWQTDLLLDRTTPLRLCSV